jgi:hypothetical protein
MNIIIINPIPMYRLKYAINKYFEIKKYRVYWNKNNLK